MSKITVTTIAGQTSGADANKVKIESGDELNVVNGDLTVDTDTLFVDASADKVGINQASPTYQLSVLGATQSTVEIESASTTGESRLYMTDPDSTGVGEIGYYHNGDTMRFNTGGAERMRLSSAGLHIGGTGAANALDDYEEGTWTATGGTGGGSVSSGAGVYTKIGRVVYVSAYLVFTGASTSGNRTYGGLPFPVLNHVAATSVDFQGMAWSNTSFNALYFDGGTSNVVVNREKTFQGSLNTANDFTRIQGFYFTT